MRMPAEDLLPGAERAVEIAGDPGIERRDMCLLARSGFCGELPCVLRSVLRGRHVRLLVGEHREVAFQAMRECELAVSRKRIRKPLSRIGAILEIAHQRAIEFGRALRARRNRKPVNVVLHLACPVGGC